MFRNNRSAVALLRFGNEQGRCLRRPRSRGEHSRLLGIREAPGGATASPPGGLQSLAAAEPDKDSNNTARSYLSWRQAEKLVRSDFYKSETQIALSFCLVEFHLPAVILPSLEDFKVP